MVGCGGLVEQVVGMGFGRVGTECGLGIQADGVGKGRAVLGFVCLLSFFVYFLVLRPSHSIKVT